MSAPYQAVILAAGRGARLSEQTDERPKALLPIGPRSLTDATATSFLRRQIETLQRFGVKQIVVVVGYRRDMVIAELKAWAPRVRIVVNPTPAIETSGSLHSFQFAARSTHGVLAGSHQTLLMDADIVYHPDVLERLLDAPAASALLVCDRHETSGEEVLVFGTPAAPRFLGKGLTPELAGGAPCLGEATGLAKYAPDDHALARATIDWLLGNPDAAEGSLAAKGFGPARRATEHEELAQRFMHYGRMRCLTFSGDALPFLEVDTPEEYAYLRESFYPRLLERES